MCSESATSFQLQQECSICLDPIDATIRSLARLTCGHSFHLDCIGSEFNFRRMMQCPNCRLVEEGEWLFAAGGFQQSIVTDDLDLENDEDIEDDDNDDDDYFVVSPSTRMYFMQNRLLYPDIGLPPPGIRNFLPMVPGSVRPAYGSAGTQAQQGFLVPESQYGAVMNNSVSINVANSQGSHWLPQSYITNQQGQAAMGQTHHTWSAPGSIHSQVAQQPQRPAVNRPVLSADAACLHAAFFSRRSNYPRPINLDASTSVGQAAQPLPYNVRHPPQQVMGQRMQDRYQREPSRSTERDVDVNIPYHRFL